MTLCERLWFGCNVVDEFALTRRLCRSVRAAYPDSTIVLITDGNFDARWNHVERDEDIKLVYGEHLYPIRNKGRVVQRLFELFLKSDCQWWAKLDPDTLCWRRFHVMPKQECFFGMVQGYDPVRSLQGGAIFASRGAVQRVVDSGLLLSDELLDYRATWAGNNKNLIERAEKKGFVSFDYVLGWAIAKLGIEVVHHIEICSYWLKEPTNTDGRYAFTHSHKNLSVEGFPPTLPIK